MTMWPAYLLALGFILFMIWTMWDGDWRKWLDDAWPLCLAAVVTALLLTWSVVAPAADTRPTACAGPGRYDAMAKGADCFNPPRDRK